LDNKEKATLFLHLSKLVMPRNEVNEDDTPQNKSITVEIVPPEIVFTREQAIEYSKKLDEMY
jgi:hypothetical protein